MTVLVFGEIAEICGARSLEAEAADTDALRTVLEERFPNLRNRTFAVAVDNSTIAGNTLLHSSSLVALLPPFSGG